jgi:hypothetical protein
VNKKKENSENREWLILDLAQRILALMKESASRTVAMDAHDVARVLFRKEQTFRSIVPPAPESR